MCSPFQILLRYLPLSNRQRSLQIMESPLVLLQPSSPHNPSTSATERSARPVGIVVSLTAQQLGHSFESVVIASEAHRDPMRIDEHGADNGELGHSGDRPLSINGTKNNAKENQAHMGLK